MNEPRKKPRSNRLGMYADVQPILEAALASSGGEYSLPSHNEAVTWRARAYKFRKMYAETVAPKPSKYDLTSMPRIAKDSSTVVINILGNHSGKFTPREEPRPLILIQDEVEAAAAELARLIDEGEVE